MKTTMQRCPNQACGARTYHYDRAVECFRCDTCGHTDRRPRAWTRPRESAFEPELTRAAGD